VVEHGVYVPLGAVITFQDDITFPKFVPGATVKFYQAAASFQGSEDGEAFGLVEGIVIVRRGDS